MIPAGVLETPRRKTQLKKDVEVKQGTKSSLGRCSTRTWQMSSDSVGLDPSLVKEREGIGMLRQGFLQSALDKGEGWNTKTSGYSNERVLVNSIKLTSQNKPFSWTWGTKLTIQVHLKQIQTKFTRNTYLQVGYYFHKKIATTSMLDCFRWTGFRVLFFNIFFFTDKEDVSIQHLHRVIWGIQSVYNILFRLAIKISVATAKHRDAVVDSELYEQSAIKHKIIWWWW